MTTKLSNTQYEILSDIGQQNGGDFGFVDEISVDGLNRHQIAGHLGPLTKMGLVYCYEYELCDDFRTKKIDSVDLTEAGWEALGTTSDERDPLHPELKRLGELLGSIPDPGATTRMPTSDRNGEPIQVSIPEDEETEEAIDDAIIAEVEAEVADWKSDAKANASDAIRKIQAKFDNARSSYHAAKQIEMYLKQKCLESKDTAVADIILRPISFGSKCWEVVWESGPFEWAVNLTLGSGLYGHGDSADFVTYGPRYFAEAMNSYSIGMFE